VTAKGMAKPMTNTTRVCENEWLEGGLLSPHLSLPAASVVQPAGRVVLESPEQFHCRCVP